MIWKETSDGNAPLKMIDYKCEGEKKKKKAA